MNKEEYEKELANSCTFHETILIKNKYIEYLERIIRLKDSHIKSLKYEIEKKG